MIDGHLEISIIRESKHVATYHQQKAQEVQFENLGKLWHALHNITKGYEKKRVDSFRKADKWPGHCWYGWCTVPKQTFLMYIYTTLVACLEKSRRVVSWPCSVSTNY